MIAFSLLFPTKMVNMCKKQCSPLYASILRKNKHFSTKLKSHFWLNFTIITKTNPRILSNLAQILEFFMSQPLHFLTFWWNLVKFWRVIHTKLEHFEEIWSKCQGSSTQNLNILTKFYPNVKGLYFFAILMKFDQNVKGQPHKFLTIWRNFVKMSRANCIIFCHFDEIWSKCQGSTTQTLNIFSKLHHILLENWWFFFNFFDFPFFCL